VHVHLKTSHREWNAWALDYGIAPMIVEYLQQRPDHLWSAPPKHEEPFSTPRGWHMLSDAITGYGDALTPEALEALAYGVLSPQHAGQFKAFAKLSGDKHRLDTILKGDATWPADPTDRDILYFLAQAFRARLFKTLPDERSTSSAETQAFTHKAKAMIRDIARISLEMAQVVVSEENGERLPSWFMVEVVRDLPRLVEKRDTVS
jgi:hypothetical protein